MNLSHKPRQNGKVVILGADACYGAGRSLLRAAMQQLHMSARAYHRTRSVKLAHAIVDVAGSERIQTVHLVEMIQYRPRRQQYWALQLHI
jgi:predicted ATPase with chaperone activity